VTTGIRVWAWPYWCVHRVFGVPYWVHRAYEVEILGHGVTMAPQKSKVRTWAIDYMACKYDKNPDDFVVEGVRWIRHD